MDFGRMLASARKKANKDPQRKRWTFNQIQVGRSRMWATGQWRWGR